MKKLICLLTVMLLILSLVGCGKPKEQNKDNNKNNNSSAVNDVSDTEDNTENNTEENPEDTASDEQLDTDNTPYNLLTNFINNVLLGESTTTQKDNQGEQGDISYNYDPLPKNEIVWDDKYGELTANELVPSLNSQYVKVTGRSATLSRGVALDYSASAISFNAVCCDRVIVTAETASTVYFSLYIDGVRQSKRICFTPTTATQTITVVRVKDKHCFELVRESDMSQGPCEVTKIQLKRGYFEEKPKNKDYYIEFIGDGITSGVGSLCGFLTGENLLSVGSAGGVACSGDENLCTAATYTYAYSVARQLNADCSFITHKNVGITACNGINKMSDYYAKESYYRNSSNFDFSSARKPDVVVINLGTMDALANKSDGAVRPQFNRLIRQIRDNYNDQSLKIVWATGLMGDAKTNAVKALVEGMNDSNIYHISDLPKAEGNHNGYPTLVEQEVASNSLINLLQGILE